jgi:uncharacterized protein
MQFNVGQLLREAVGAERHYEIEEDLSWLEPEVRGVSPLRGTLSLLKTVQRILCTGMLKCKVEMDCVRCLEPFVVEVEVPIEEEFGFGDGGSASLRLDDPALMIDERNILDISEVVRQNVLLALPTRPLCRPDCRGLCPTCGENLNQGVCTCSLDAADPRWASLRSLVGGRARQGPAWKEERGA